MSLTELLMYEISKQGKLCSPPDNVITMASPAMSLWSAHQIYFKLVYTSLIHHCVTPRLSQVQKDANKDVRIKSMTNVMVWLQVSENKYCLRHIMKVLKHMPTTRILWTLIVGFYGLTHDEVSSNKQQIYCMRGSDKQVEHSQHLSANINAVWMDWCRFLSFCFHLHFYSKSSALHHQNRVRLLLWWQQSSTISW